MVANGFLEGRREAEKINVAVAFLRGVLTYCRWMRVYVCVLSLMSEFARIKIFVLNCRAN